MDNTEQKKSTCEERERERQNEQGYGEKRKISKFALSHARDFTRRLPPTRIKLTDEKKRIERSASLLINIIKLYTFIPHRGQAWRGF